MPNVSYTQPVIGKFSAWHKRYEVKEFHKLYNTEFSQLDYFDFSGIIMEDEMYTDLIHLNKKASSYFSNFLQNSSWESFRYVK